MHILMFPTYKYRFNPNWMSPALPTTAFDKLALRTAFEKAVKRRMMSDVPWLAATT